MNCKFLRKKNFASRIRILQLFAFLGGLAMLMVSDLKTYAQFANVPVTGFNADIVADGLGSLGSTSSTTDVDGTGSGFVFASSTFGPVATICAPAGASWPASNQITSVNTTTATGITYQLQSPGNGTVTNNNSLKIANGASGTLTLVTPVVASNLYFVCLGGNGAVNFTATITFSDATTQTTPVTSAPDWCNGAATYKITTQQYYRISRTAATCVGALCQYIYEVPVAIGGANYNKTITSITFNNTNTSGTTSLHVLAVGMKAPCSVPTVNPTALNFTDSTSSTVTGSFTVGNANNYLVVRYPTGSTTTAPVNGTAYTVGGALGTGTIVSAGTINTFTASGLNPSTGYDFYVYGYNTGNTCGGPVFNITPISATQWTKSCATLTSGTIATTATSACPSIAFTLSLTGATTGPAITYQWQSAPTGTGSFVNVASGGTSSTYAASQTVASDYRCILTCSGGNTASTPNITITMNPPTSCYCVPTSTTATNYFISSFSTTGGTTNITNNGTGSGQYNDYFATMSASASQGTVVNFSWTGNTASSQKRAIYIDWNQNGSFTDAGEQVYNGTAITSATNTGSFTIPYSALTGTTRMRIRSTQNSNTMTPCGPLSNGETEDYAITVVLATGCVNPVNLNVTATTSSTATIDFSVPPVGNAPTNYIYELRTDGTAAGSGATGLAQNGTVTTTPITLSGLGQGTNYVLFARTYCSAGDTSNWTSIALTTTYDILTPVPLTGFNADVIANGVGAASTSTNNDVDGANYGLLANDYRTTSVSPAPTNSLPMSRNIVNGLKNYKLAPYYSNNSLRMSAVSSGMIRFLAPKKANRVYVMGVSGSGISTNVATIYFRDGSTQTATQGYPDWYVSGNNVASAVGRINYGNNVAEAGPYLHDSAIVISTVNRDKQIDSIGFTHTGTVMNVLAVSIIPNTNQSCRLPLAIDSAFTITSGTASIAFRGNGTNTNYQLSLVAQGAYADAGIITTGSGSGANTTALSGLSAATNYQVYVRTNCGSGSYSDWIGPIDFTTLASNCTGTPATGTLTASATSVCLNTAYNLSVANVSTSIGITLKWQSSPTGLNTWTTLSSVTPILGTTTYNYNVLSQTAATDYRCVIACSYSNDSSVSNLVTVAQNSFNNCYCLPTASASTYPITNFQTTGATANVNITSAGGITSAGYSNYSLTDTVKAVINTVVNFSGSTTDNGVKIWVDWNHDGDFDDAGENVYSSGGYVASFSGSFTVPLNALVGYTRMRVKADYNSTAPTTCGNVTNGETEDYAFYAIAQPACAGVPAPGNTNAVLSSFCVSGSTNLSVDNNYISSSGITYQWQSSTNGTVWSDVQSATSYTLTTPVLTQTTSFRLRVRCAAGPDTAYSTAKAITINPLPNVTVNPVQGAFCTAGNATLVASGASTYTWTPSATLNISTGNTVIASPTVITTYTVTGTDANSCSNSAVASVGPISAFTPVAVANNTCAANLPVSISVVPIATAVGNMEYRVTDTLGTVIADWQAGSNFTVTPTIQGAYKYYVFARNTTCTTSLSDTGTVFFYVGFGAAVISNNASCTNGDGSLIIGNVQGPGSGSAPYTWYSNDFSTSTFDPIYAELKGVASVTSGYLQLTPNVTSQNGGLIIKNPTGIGGHLDSVKFALSVPTSGADGLSWSFGDNLIYYGTGDSSNLEAGVGNKLIISFDAYGTSGNGTNGIYLTYGQTNSYFGLLTTVTSTMLAYSNNLSWRATTNKQIIVSISSSDKLTLTVGGTVVFNAIQLPAAYTSANKSTWQHMIAARTGGVAEQHYIDNLGIYYTGDSYLYGSAPAGSGTMPSSWQTSPIFSGLNGGDSLDLWVANPSSATTCNQKLGTFGVSAPVTTSLLSFDNPSCMGADDGYIQMKVPVAGTYSVSYNKNGGSTITQTGLISNNDGTNENIIFFLNQGSYTNLKVMNATPCVSNTIAGPIVLVAPTANTVAAASDVSAPMAQPGAGTQYYTNSTCDLIAAITSSNNLGQVTASVNVSNTVSTATSGEPFLGRSYVITPSQNTTLGATLKLFFTAADFANYNAAPSVGTTYPVILSNGSNLKIRAFHGLPGAGTTGPGGSYDVTNSDILQPTGITWNNIGNFWVVDVYSPNGFSGFFANTTTGVPLNITLGKISARNEGAVNILDWNTKSEEANDKFVIERSNDGRIFSRIGTQLGKGNAPSEYTFTDNKPFSGVNYYRLIMMNVDGTQEYSKIVTAEVKNGDRFRFNVFPNPATSEVTVTVSDVIGKGWIELTDITGRTIVSKDVTANTSLSLSLTGLAEGMYIVKFHDDTRVQTLKINKSK